MTAATACRTCGTEPRQGARFCDGCGAPITERDAHAEYKQVTVLFADVVRSMDIAAAVGAERLREIMAQLVERATVLMQYGVEELPTASPNMLELPRGEAIVITVAPGESGSLIRWSGWIRWTR